MLTTDTIPKDVSSQNLAVHLIDVRLPEPVSWWPFATGWWVLLAVLSTLMAWWLWRWIKRSRRVRQHPAADHIYQQLTAQGDAALYCLQITTLLRQTALKTDDRKAIASLQGEAWVRWLEQSGGLKFSTQAHALLSHDCYRESPLRVGPSVHNEFVQWLVHHAGRKSIPPMVQTSA